MTFFCENVKISETVLEYQDISWEMTPTYRW